MRSGGLHPVDARGHADVHEGHGVGAALASTASRTAARPPRPAAPKSSSKRAAGPRATGSSPPKSKVSMASRSSTLRAVRERILRKSWWMEGLSSTTRMRRLSAGFMPRPPVHVRAARCGSARPGPGLRCQQRRWPFIASAASALACSPNPWPSFLVVKPWVNKRGQVLGGDAHPVVGHLDVQPRLVLALHADGEPLVRAPALHHGMARVVQEVDQDLQQLVPVHAGLGGISAYSRRIWMPGRSKDSELQAQRVIEQPGTDIGSTIAARRACSCCMLTMALMCSNVGAGCAALGEQHPLLRASCSETGDEVVGQRRPRGSSVARKRPASACCSRRSSAAFTEPRHARAPQPLDHEVGRHVDAVEGVAHVVQHAPWPPPPCPPGATPP